MRKIYLIRHGQPEFPNGETICIGRTELPLSRLGRMQAYLAWERLREKGVCAVYSSPLIRAVQTAEYSGGAVKTDDGFSERYAGDWEGLSFTEVKLRFPELYAARGIDSSIPMPNSESDADCIKRFEAAMLRALGETQGDIAVYSHRSICCAWLGKYCALSQNELRKRISYCTISTIDFDGRFSPALIGEAAKPEMTRGRAEALLALYGTPEDVRRHCRAVAELAGELSSELGLDGELAFCAGLLHDIARTEKNHAASGAELMERLGYPELGKIISRHHELGGAEHTDEAAAVYIADKMLCGTRRVSIEERFKQSLAKCTSEEAVRANRRRYAEAAELQKIINKKCGRSVIL